KSQRHPIAILIQIIRIHLPKPLPFPILLLSLHPHHPPPRLPHQRLNHHLNPPSLKIPRNKRPTIRRFQFLPSKHHLRIRLHLHLPLPIREEKGGRLIVRACIGTTAGGWGGTRSTASGDVDHGFEESGEVFPVFGKVFGVLETPGFGVGDLAEGEIESGKSYKEKNRNQRGTTTHTTDILCPSFHQIPQLPKPFLKPLSTHNTPHPIPRCRRNHKPLTFSTSTKNASGTVGVDPTMDYRRRRKKRRWRGRKGKATAVVVTGVDGERQRRTEEVTMEMVEGEDASMGSWG
ncbi:hypothetical protein BC829DRAFT_397874, partial [Chytridium lagenaria]